ncbi:hypothetical protein GCAAIG_06605 [Candidatus Electronema halotolerans]
MCIYYPLVIMNILKGTGVLVLMVASFLAGILWSKHHLLESGPMLLTSSLTLASASNGKGTLPEGTILYPYSKHDTNTYVVFVNTKNLDLLKPISFEQYLTVAPITGYRE